MDEAISLTHGAGGSVMDRLIREVIVRGIRLRSALDGVGLDHLDDGASLVVGDYEVVVSMDGHTVDPIFFPGGDIGRLAISGAINDVSVMGARPVAIADSIVVEEGFQVSDLERIMKSMDSTAGEAGVAIIGGDLKVMPRGKLDKIVVATCGVGIVRRGSIVLDSGARPGDRVIITGPIGDHGVTLLSKRMGLEFETELRSDVAPVWGMVEAALGVGGVTAMKDPTRGGIASALNEIAQKSGVSIWLDEGKIPINDSVRAACEMLGLDPFEITCEGRAIVCVQPEKAMAALEAIHKISYGREAVIVGTVRAEKPGYVYLETVVGGTRIIDKPIGEPIPRVC